MYVYQTSVSDADDPHKASRVRSAHHELSELDPGLSMSVRHQTQATGQPDLGLTRIGEQLRIPALLRPMGKLARPLPHSTRLV